MKTTMDSETLWAEALKIHGLSFCDADDTLKKSTAELKPVKVAHKEHKEKMTALMTQKNKRSARFGDSRVRLHKRVQKPKAPSKDTIRDRCHEWDGERGEELYRTLMAPEPIEEQEARYTVRRSLVTEAEAEDDKLARSLQMDALDSEEEEEE